MVVNDESKLDILPVTVLRAEPKKVYLRGGIEAGARVITTTLDAPVPGTKLAISGAVETLPTPIEEGSEQ